MKKKIKGSEKSTTRPRTRPKNPTVFIISGPGGAGKTTLIKKLFQQANIQKGFLRGITVTTRKKRPKESEGKDYFFVSPEEFRRLENHKFFLETQKVLDNSYGTPKIFYTLAKAQGKDLILCIDVRGGLYLKKNYKAGKIVTIFIDAPNKKELVKRMKKRAGEKKTMQERVQLAKQEIAAADQYEHHLTNKNIKSTVEELEKIILKNRKIINRRL